MKRTKNNEKKKQSSFRGKVIAAERKFRRAQLQQHFEEVYDKLRDYEFPERDKINMERFFGFPKLLSDFIMSSASIAVYPVLCAQADFIQDNWFQISLDNIAKMAGISPATVINGIDDLQRYKLGEIPYVEKDKRTRERRTFNVYRVRFIRKDMLQDWEGNYFPFHTCLIHSGVWADLKPRSKALYVAMRANAYFDKTLYEMIEDISSHDLISLEGYTNRKWDVCNHSLSALCNYVKIARSNLQPVLQQLENHRLIERVDSYFVVYLKPRI